MSLIKDRKKQAMLESHDKIQLIGIDDIWLQLMTIMIDQMMFAGFDDRQADRCT